MTLLISVFKTHMQSKPLGHIKILGQILVEYYPKQTFFCTNYTVRYMLDLKLKIRYKDNKVKSNEMNDIKHGIRK